MHDEYIIVAADHPSLAGDIELLLTELQDEQRYFGPSARSNPKPSRSLIASLRERGGFRMAVVHAGRMVGMARVDGAGELFMALAPEHRDRGIGVELGRAVAVRARDLHYTRLVMRSTKRSRAARRVGEELGCFVIDGPHGRTEFILDLLPVERSA
jgi:GNAT superfamily N-acetyltransferase